MKRAVLVVVLLAISAEARSKPAMPTLVNRCRAAESWEKLEDCASHFGTLTVEHELDGARLARLTGRRSFGEGLYLYIPKDGRWILGGSFTALGDVESFRRITIAKIQGYMFDVMTVNDFSDPPWDRRTSTYFMKRTRVYCAGTTPYCTLVMMSCDLYVKGKTQSTYRGTPTLDGLKVKNIGDRTHANDPCVPPEEQPLAWSQ